jgi:hypothetical protein
MQSLIELANLPEEESLLLNALKDNCIAMSYVYIFNPG